MTLGQTVASGLRPIKHVSLPEVRAAVSHQYWTITFSFFNCSPHESHKFWGFFCFVFFCFVVFHFQKHEMPHFLSVKDFSQEDLPHTDLWHNESLKNRSRKNYF